MPDLLAAIVTHTPLWVWGLLFILVRLGLRQTVARDVSATRLLLLPVAIGALSLASAAFAFGAAGPGWVLAAWCGGALLGFAAHLTLANPQAAARANADGSLRVEGSIAPLALMMCVFFARYANGVALSMHPALGSLPAYAAVASVVFALPAGILAARSRRLLAAGRRCEPLAA